LRSNAIDKGPEFRVCGPIYARAPARIAQQSRPTLAASHQSDLPQHHRGQHEDRCPDQQHHNFRSHRPAPSEAVPPTHLKPTPSAAPTCQYSSDGERHSGAVWNILDRFAELGNGGSAGFSDSGWVADSANIMHSALRHPNDRRAADASETTHMRLGGVCYRWVGTPQRAHSNLVVRMMPPNCLTLKPSGSLFTLRVPRGRSGSSSGA
jgi:hypothetical protein